MNRKFIFTDVSYSLKTELNLVFQSVFRLALVLLMTSCLMGCTTCNQKLIERIRNNDQQWTADLNYARCGYLNEYAVSIYSTGSDPEVSKDIFQASVRAKAPFPDNQSPISIKWTDNRSLLIRHDTIKSVEDPEKKKLAVTRAVEKCPGISVSYDPEPHIWWNTWGRKYDKREEDELTNAGCVLK